MTRSSSLFRRDGGGGNSDNATMVDHDGDRPLPAVRSVDNFDALARDLRFLAGMPELCDVTFLVGENRTPLHGVRAILAIRSRLVGLFVILVVILVRDSYS
uniref:Uncharacterized protein n=1 Tax=Plectus sambesii TaxID=2011161 RepID=A0A914X413_9BILA